MNEQNTEKEERVVSPFFEMQELTSKHQWLSELRQQLFRVKRSTAIRLGLADGVIAKLGASKASAYMYNKRKQTLKLLCMYGIGDKQTLEEKGKRIAKQCVDLEENRCIFEYDVNNRRNSLFAKARPIPDEGYEWLTEIIENNSETESPIVDTRSTDKNPFIAFSYAIDDNAGIVFKIRKETFPPHYEPEFKQLKLSLDAILSQIRNKLVDSAIKMNTFDLESADGFKQSIPALGVSYLGVPESMLFQKIVELSQYTSGCHFDVMDGLYVEKYGTFDIDGTGLPKSDFPFVTNMMLEKILKESKFKLFIDAHLMVYDPVPYIIEYGFSGVNSVTVSYRKDFLELRKEITLIQQMGMLAGVAIKPKHTLNDIEDILPDLDTVLVMTVEPGKGGQPFMREMLQKISDIKTFITENGLHCKIQVDGGINEETGPLALAAGADLIVSGSTMVKSPNPQETYKKILGIKTI